VPRPEAAWLGAQAKTLRASEQDRADVAAARITWRSEVAAIDPSRLVFLDESGFDTRLVRTHARAPRGQRAHGKAPGGHWRRLTLIGALAVEGICASMTVAAATGTDVFLAFVTEVLIPALKSHKPDAVVVMDNLAAHKAARVRQAFDQAGIRYLYLPAYSPDMNPIEQAWSKLKTYLRAISARSLEALEAAIPDALATLTPSNAQGWFRHAGYPPN
jgi:transposase